MLAIEARPAKSTLVGRSGFVVAIEAASAAGQGVLLVGPRGIGKSALLTAVADAARERGETVLRLDCAESERSMAFQGFTDLVGSLPPESIRDIAPEHRPWVRAALSGRVHGDPRIREACRIGWHALVDRCASRAPVLLVVDDAQWLDPASAEVFAYAARRLRDRPVRVVLAGRWVDDAHERVTRSLLPPPVAVLTVPQLNLTDVAVLLEQQGLPARTVSKIHADCAGNPQLALALAASRGILSAGVPHRVAVLVHDKFASLPARCRETLLVCALAVRPSIRLLLRAGRCDAETDIARAIEAGLVVSDGEHIRFTPPEAATVVARSATSAQRGELHLVLAGAVTFSAEADRHRALATDRPDPDLARSLGDAAAHALRRGVRDLAAELFLLAADHAPQELEASRVEWLVEAAEIGANACLPDIVTRAARAVLAADAQAAQRVRVRLALLRLAGQGSPAVAETLAAVSTDAAGDSESLTLIHLWRAWSAYARGDLALADSEAATTVDLARLRADATTESLALALRALTMRLTGRLDYTLALEKGLALADPDADGLRHCGPRFISTRFAAFDDRLVDAHEDLLGLLATVERGTAEELSSVLRVLAEVSARQGRCQDSIGFADRAIRIAGESGLRPGPSWYGGAVAELAGGSIARAEIYAKGGLRAAEDDNDVVFRRNHLHVLGQIRLRQGDIPEAVRVLRLIRDLDDASGINDPTMVRWHGDLAAGLILVGEMAEAERVIGGARDALAGRPHSVGAHACLDRAEAALLTARGQTGVALERLHAAVLAFQTLGQPLERGHCLLVEAQIERRRRHYSAARAAVEAALLLFIGAGATPWIGQAETLLARLSDIGDNGGTLTASEARIAAMVGEGATNQEIADQLYLSVKTVESTLTKIYRKLGIRSRIQLGARLRSG
ncbi:MAG: LuxR family transcriptional regulator [Actinomycetota bacterium]|nr:LuxR family transcriptional regulator [Actinomycetota bacterium]